MSMTFKFGDNAEGKEYTSTFKVVAQSVLSAYSFNELLKPDFSSSLVAVPTGQVVMKVIIRVINLPHDQTGAKESYIDTTVGLKGVSFQSDMIQYPTEGLDLNQNLTVKLSFKNYASFRVSNAYVFSNAGMANRTSTPTEMRPDYPGFHPIIFCTEANYFTNVDRQGCVSWPSSCRYAQGDNTCLNYESRFIDKYTKDTRTACPEENYLEEVEGSDFKMCSLCPFQCNQFT
jgi:hypothetical protein